MKKPIKKDPYIEKMDEIIKQLHILNGALIYKQPYTAHSPVIPPQNAVWCPYCRVYNCGQMHITC